MSARRLGVAPLLGIYRECVDDGGSVGGAEAGVWRAAKAKTIGESR